MIYPKIFERCIEIILKNEGGLVDHPSDPGGLTNMGITQRCVSPDSKILTSDLVWINASSIKKDDKLIGFNEIPEVHGKLHMRRFCLTEVSDISIEVMPSVRIITKHGDVLYCSSDHRWLVQIGSHKELIWVKANELLTHPTTRGIIYRKKSTITYLNKIFDVWKFDDSRDAGYLAGFFDGEGCISSYAIQFAQKQNASLDNILKILSNKGYNYSLLRDYHGCLHYKINNINKYPHFIPQFIGNIGAKRLIQKYLSNINNWRIDTNNTSREEILYVDVIEDSSMVAIKTNCNTLFVDGYASHNSYPMEDIKNLTKEKATAIYYRDYWLPMDLELLNNPDLILQIFDMGVNSGMRTSIKILQRLIGTIADGYIGQMTVRAIEDFNGDIVEEYTKRRKLFYVTLAQSKPELRIFLKGWLRRIEKTKFT